MTEDQRAPESLTDRELLARLAAWVVERRMAVPAILFLESHRPLSYLGSQAMIIASPFAAFLEPFLKQFAGPGYRQELYDRFAVLMEKRENLERLIVEVERANQDQREIERAEKAAKKELQREARRRRKELRATRKQKRDRDGS